MDDSSYDRMLYDFESIYFRLERQIYKFTNIKELLSTDTAYPGSKVINLGDILRDAVLSSHIGRLVDLKSKTIKAYQLLTQPEMIGLLTFQQSNLDLLENINTLGSTKSFLNKDKNFKEVRIVDGYNMRKNTSGTTIEAKGSNGTWYLVEYVLNDKIKITFLISNQKNDNIIDNYDVLYWSDKADRVNLKDTLFEILFVEVPFKKLCSNNCKGICLDCGINLNNEPCSCED